MGIALTKSSIDLGIVTSNGPAMLAFYRDLLGLKYEGEMAMPGKGVMHRLMCGDSLIKLRVMPTEPAVNPSAPGGIQKAAGLRYWTMTISNLTEMVKACADAGTPIVVPETEFRPGVFIAIVTDPDGNWVEFLSLRG